MAEISISELLKGTFEVPEEGIKALKSRILKALQDDPSLGSYVSKFLKTENTFDNSLNAIDDFIIERRALNKESSYVPTLKYDEKSDSLVISHVRTKKNILLDEATKMFVYSNVEALWIVKNGYELYENIGTLFGGEKLSPLGKAAFKSIQIFNDTSDQPKGCVFQCNGDLSTKLLDFTALIAALNKHKVSCISGSTIQEDWRNYNQDEEFTYYWNKAFTTECLFLSNFQKLPWGHDALMSTIVPLMKMRNQKGFYTFIGVNEPLDQCIGRLEFKKLDGEILKAVIEKVCDTSLKYFNDIG